MTRPTTGFPYLDDSEGVLAFAHRGGARHPDLTGLENTLAAFQHAVSLGYRYLETDVHATSDGVLLAFHDAALDRVTDRQGVIYEQPYVDVAAAQIGGAHAIPKLEDLMELFPQARFNIDIKSRGANEPLADLIERAKAHDRVLIGSFDEAVIRTFRRRLARPVATACGPVAAAALKARLPIRDGGVAFQVPHRHRGILLVTKGFVRRAHAAGRHVHVWTIDDPDEMHELLDLGVDGIFSDRTDLLREVLIERGEWEGVPAMSQTPAGIANLEPLERQREQRAWYWYDWANSAYVTTTAAVLFAPYLTTVAERAAGCAVGDDAPDCHANLSVLGLSVSPGSLVFYLVTLATILSALVLPVVGAAADRSSRKTTLLGGYAWVGSIFAALMFFVAGENWQLGALLLVAATLCLGSSLVVYDAILCDIATPDERDRVSSRGWARGYLGGGLLLAANFGLLSVMDDTELAVRISLLSAAAWWAAFTIIPYRGIRNRPPVNVVPEHGGLVRESFGQLWQTLKDLRGYPVTLTFLVGYLFYNDGIQTVIYAASVYGEKQLGFEKSTVLSAFLVVQFVGVAGALLFGRVAERVGARKVILVGLGIWVVVVSLGYFAPEKNLPVFLVLAASIGLVLGGTQALSRSFFSLLIPRGREAEYFSLYQACERGTSWLGTLVFGLVHQWTDSYRPAIFALMVFFVVGGVLLAKVDPRRGIAEAGNQAPVVV